MTANTAENTVIEAVVRETTGKGSARAVRRENRIPGIVYGGNGKDIPVAVGLKQVTQLYNTGHFLAQAYELQVGKEKIHVLPRAIQLHPVTDVLEHVDFLRLEKGSVVKVKVKVRFINADKSLGLKRGGILNIVRREVELLCNPDAIPTSITVDLAGKQIGSSIHISHVPLPEGVKPAITDRDFTIAAIAGRGGKADTTEGEEGAAAATAAPAAKAAAKPAK